MPIITDIKQQQRHSGRFSIYLDGQYVFSLDDLALGSSGLRVGQELSGRDVEQWQKRSAEGKAYNAALRFLSYRPRSRHELRDSLLRKEYDPQTVEAVLVRLEGAGMVNDAAFAASWVASRRALQHRSKQVLLMELLQKGVAKDTATAVLQEISSDDQLETLVQLAARKSQLGQYKDPQKLIAYLSRQGFRYSEIKQALARLEDLAGSN